MTYTLPSGLKTEVHPGQFIHCNVFNEPIRVEAIVTSYAFPIYQAMPDGTIRKIA